MTQESYGSYRVAGEIGRGGMGVVFRATDPTLDRPVALKLLPTELAEGEQKDRLLREARAAASLSHPNIVTVYAAGEEEGRLYIAMEYVEGQTLGDLLAERGPLEPSVALSIADKIAAGLEAAHLRGIIHRDIKPDNIMLCLPETGLDDETLILDDPSALQDELLESQVKIMDFGLAADVRQDTITREGSYLGTPRYSSPEQVNGEPLDARTDLYSLGAVLFEMLTGRAPHEADRPAALFNRILNEDAPNVRSLNPNVPPAVADLVADLLARKPSDRPARAADVSTRIERLLNEAEPPGTGSPSSPRPRPLLAGILILCLIALPFLLPHLLSEPGEGAPDPPPTPRPEEKSEAGTFEKKSRYRLAVCDFQNLKQIEEANWIQVAISSTLASHLAQVAYLDPMPRLPTTEGTDPVAIAEKTDADLVLTGDYTLLEGGTLLINAQIQGGGGEHLVNAVSVNGREADFVALMDELGRRLFQNLNRRLGTEPTTGGEGGLVSVRDRLLARVDGDSTERRRRRNDGVLRRKLRQKVESQEKKKVEGEGGAGPPVATFGGEDETDKRNEEPLTENKRGVGDTEDDRGRLIQAIHYHAKATLARESGADVTTVRTLLEKALEAEPAYGPARRALEDLDEK